MSPDPFSAALRDPARPKPAGIIGPNGKAAERRFAVYRNNVAHSLVEAMGRIFPSVRAACGDERFRDVALLFVRAAPPRSPILAEYGDGFPAFLDAFAPARERMPWLADLARLERLWLEAYHAADAEPLAATTLAGLSPDALAEAVIVPHPAAAVLASRHAIHALFDAGRMGLPMPDPDQPQAVLVTRPHLGVEVRLLPPGGHVFFAGLLAGRPLGAALDAALGDDPRFDPAAALAALILSGAAAGLAPETPR